MEKVIIGWGCSFGIATIHWIAESTSILEYATLCMTFIAITATAIIAWRKVFKK